MYLRLGIRGHFGSINRVPLLVSILTAEAATVYTAHRLQR